MSASALFPSETSSFSMQRRFYSTSKTIEVGRDGKEYAVLPGGMSGLLPSPMNKSKSKKNVLFSDIDEYFSDGSYRKENTESDQESDPSNTSIGIFYIIDNYY